MGDQDTLGLNVLNAIMGLVVVLGIGAVAVSILYGIAVKLKRRIMLPSELDRDMRAFFGTPKGDYADSSPSPERRSSPS